MFHRKDLDALFDELRERWSESRDFDRLTRDAHLAIALFDAGRPLGDDVDPKVVALIERHRPTT